MEPQFLCCRVYMIQRHLVLRLKNYIIFIRPKIKILILILIKIYIAYHHSWNSNTIPYLNPGANPSDILNL